VYLSGAAYSRPSQQGSPTRHISVNKTYPEILDVGEDLVVEREVIARNDINTGLLLNIPVLETKPLGLGKEVGLGELSAPVCFGGLLQVAVDAHAGKTEDGADRQLASRIISRVQIRGDIRLNHDCGSGR
jgi:hypothetical protein